MTRMPWLQHDRTDAEIAAEIRRTVETYGLHVGFYIMGARCCTLDELDAAIALEVAARRAGSTGMIITTGQGPSRPGVFLPAPENALTPIEQALAAAAR